MSDLKSVYSHSPSVVTRKTGDEYVLVPVANNIADMNSVYTLNETGAFIWEHIDGHRCVKDLIEAIIDEYETDERTAEQDVYSFLAEMGKFLIINENSVQ
jgi:hypothetical protein